MKKIVEKKYESSGVDQDYLKRWKKRPREWIFEWLIAAKEFNVELKKNRIKKTTKA